jgi:AcrR family transcriptional regulator
MLRVRQSLRARKMQQTRSDIAAAALALMDRDGYAATTMEAIADAAGVSRRTVFRYFSDKEEVVFADDPVHTEVILAAVDGAAPEAAPLQVVRRAGHALAAELERGAKDVARWSALVATEPALQARYLAKQRRWEALLAERLAQREGTAPEAAALAAKIGVACVQAAFDRWIADPRRPLGEHVDAAFAALAGLVAEPGG